MKHTLSRKRYLRKYYRDAIKNIHMRKKIYLNLQKACQNYHELDGEGSIIRAKTFHLLGAANTIIDGLPRILEWYDKELKRKTRLLRGLK